jgi:hypothetical protein
MAGDLVEQFNEKSTANENFIKLIKESLKQLPENQNLVIFIDELDRCRPTYAIELLERIKHLFNIKRLVFVLSTDTEQLSHSICAVYGNNFDAKKYLNRFIDLDYLLKEPDLKMYIKNRFQSLWIHETKTLKEKDEIEETNLSLIDLINFFAKRLDLDLRSVNLMTTRLVLILLTFSKLCRVSKLDEIAILTLLFLRQYNYELYKKYQTSQSEIEEIIKFLTQKVTIKELSQNDQTNYINCLKKILAFLYIFMNKFDVEIMEEKMFKKCVDGIINCCSYIPPWTNHIPDYDEQFSEEFSEEIKEIKKIKKTQGIDEFTESVYVHDIIERIELLYRINI